MTWLPHPVFSYFGPETTLPVASALVAVVGVLLVCWRRVVGIAIKAVRCVTGKREPPDGPDRRCRPE